jgi:hypothetical protein
MRKQDVVAIKAAIVVDHTIDKWNRFGEFVEEWHPALWVFAMLMMMMLQTFPPNARLINKLTHLSLSS